MRARVLIRVLLGMSRDERDAELIREEVVVCERRAGVEAVPLADVAVREA